MNSSFSINTMLLILVIFALITMMAARLDHAYKQQICLTKSDRSICQSNDQE